MSELTAERLAQRIIDCNVIEARQMEAVFGELGTREVSLNDFTSLLVRRGLLTNFQLDRLVKGERGGYFYSDYKVLYLVGTGTFARVYRVVNTKTGKVFALKVLRKRFREERAQTEQFLREGEIGSRLRHPNIVPIYEVSSDPTAPYLVMEFVEGTNLRAFIVKARRKFSPAEAVGIAIDICAGLKYAAEKGMSHRDLKLSNVLVTSRGRAKLVDFGLALITESMREGIAEESITARTIDYVGLERASGAAKKDDPRSDIYFAGCILYHILTGVAPLTETRDKSARLSVQRFQEIRPILAIDPSLPRAIVAVVQKSMELNPDKRYSRAADMLADLTLVQKRLEEGTADVDLPAPGTTPGATVLAGQSPSLDQEGQGKTVMVVESKIEMQDALREQLKKRGYKVMIISDADRAVARFNEFDPPVADVVMFCTPELGESALRAFSNFASLPYTKNIPAILFIDQKQSSIIRSASLNEHRVLLSMPLKVKELREILLKLLSTAQPLAQP